MNFEIPIKYIDYKLMIPPKYQWSFTEHCVLAKMWVHLISVDYILISQMYLK